MLHFGAPPPISFEKFLKACEGLLDENDMEIIKASGITAAYGREAVHPLLAEYRAFDTALRNELVKIRASRKKVDPSPYLREDGHSEPAIAHIAMNAYKNTSILEAERMLDRERWQTLDDLAMGHYFDIEFLIVYAHKLLILERWERVRRLDRKQALEEALQKEQAS